MDLENACFMNWTEHQRHCRQCNYRGGSTTCQEGKEILVEWDLAYKRTYPPEEQGKIC